MALVHGGLGKHPPDPGTPTSGRVYPERLQELRLTRNLSQQALSRTSHVSKSYISELEHGKKTPEVGTAKALDVALGADGELAGLVVVVDATPTSDSGKHLVNRSLLYQPAPFVLAAPDSVATTGPSLWQPHVGRARAGRHVRPGQSSEQPAGGADAGSRRTTGHPHSRLTRLHDRPAVPGGPRPNRPRRSCVGRPDGGRSRADLRACRPRERARMGMVHRRCLRLR